MPKGNPRGLYDPEDYKIEALWLDEAEKLHLAMKKIYPEILSEILKNIIIKEKMEYSFGEYMDRQEIIIYRK
jgi:hypothetical protein